MVEYLTQFKSIGNVQKLSSNEPPNDAYLIMNKTNCLYIIPLIMVKYTEYLIIKPIAMKDAPIVKLILTN